jgi:cob(I)alamin adenosyltransferase
MRPSISTTGGDKGTTGLFGGQRVSKADARLHAYGTVDEMNAVLGVVLSEGVPEELSQQLHQIQKDLFILGADLATPLSKEGNVVRIAESDILNLEQWGKELEDGLSVLQKFILPSGCKVAAYIHMARTICRRAERWTIQVAEAEEVNQHALVYLNRLSDYFFLLARTANKAHGTQEQQWLP